MTGERGFSLVEVVVAILILTVGVLGLAASAGAITKLTAEGGRAGGAAAAADTRFEILRGTSCASMTNGSATSGKYTVTWTVTSTTTLLRTVLVTVSYPSGRSTRTVNYTSQISCAPSV
jgi:prepilin-type N-terminal cleavage/methylation domain-containing protein